jgi:hypothetical protein
MRQTENEQKNSNITEKKQNLETFPLIDIDVCTDILYQSRPKRSRDHTCRLQHFL